MPIGYLCQWICLTELTHYFYLLLPQFCDLWLLFGKIKALKSDRFKGFCFFVAYRHSAYGNFLLGRYLRQAGGAF